MAFFAEILNFLGSLKMVLWEISQNSPENICAGISVFDKVKLCRSAASLKTRQVFSCEFCKICLNTFLRKTTWRLTLIIAVSTINYFRKKAPSQIFYWVEDRLQVKGLKYWAHSCFQLQIKPRKYSAGKYVWHHFWKDERCLCRSNAQRVLLKRCYEKFRRNHKEACAGISFLIKVNSVNLRLL